MRTSGWVLTLFGLLTFSAWSAVNTGTSTIDFESITGGGTCAVSADSPVVLGDKNGIDPTPALDKDWVGLGKTTFKINLTGCVGLGGATTAPKITLSGTTVSGKSATANDSLFSTGTNATGFGVIIYNTDNPGAGNTNIATSSGGTIPIPGYGLGTALNGDTSVTLMAAVGCGTAVDCKGETLNPGALSASITFGFAYK
ncbi:TPA: type 1 fimbrial protein [Serratia marcescens]|uniref:Type 1 fimbrial protein n=1 Tax=Serratia ureilytica TaxID=300181 RepID=A0A9X9BXV5_9GAMM|nr:MULTISPECIES: type 1 fimbrial protein [Serratia]MBS3894521.1 type 1 fimbrial protein [Serratia marcescens]TXE22533.1 type 1 fimbrial protein [Serratia ureilytica]HBC7422437.1 type 1 fimbrial protein [Serratia marcescens]